MASGKICYASSYSQTKGGSPIATREEKVSFFNARGDRLSGILHIPAEAGIRPSVILCHGMESNKESEKLISLSRSLSKRGLLALRFDFFCAGESSGQFEQITYSAEVEDLRAAFDLLQRYPVGKMGIIGSSMGGSVALLFASQEKRVASLVTLAAPAHPEKITDRLLSPEEIRCWQQTGFITYHGRRINNSFLDDLQKINIPRAAEQISCPALFIHGDADATVPVEDAYELYARVSSPKRICILEGADHRFSNPKDVGRALSKSLDWMIQHLCDRST